MPSKASNHIAFFVVLAISLWCHRYVFLNWKRRLVQDFPAAGKRLARVAFWLFVVMDLPFIFIYFRNQLPGEHAFISKVILYPFSTWLALMFFWTIALWISHATRRASKAGVAVYQKVRSSYDDDGALPALPSTEYLSTQE